MTVSWGHIRMYHTHGPCTLPSFAIKCIEFSFLCPAKCLIWFCCLSTMKTFCHWLWTIILKVYGEMSLFWLKVPVCQQWFPFRFVFLLLIRDWVAGLTVCSERSRHVSNVPDHIKYSMPIFGTYTTWVLVTKMATALDRNYRYHLYYILYKIEFNVFFFYSWTDSDAPEVQKYIYISAFTCVFLSDSRFSWCYLISPFNKMKQIVSF